MVVVGNDCTIFDDTGQTCTVNAFSESAGCLEKVLIVDAVVAYDCPFQAKTYLLMMRNALHIPDIKVNLIPPFIIREAGIQINECPKFQSSDPTVQNHSMFLQDNDL